MASKSLNPIRHRRLSAWLFRTGMVLLAWVYALDALVWHVASGFDAQMKFRVVSGVPFFNPNHNSFFRITQDKLIIGSHYSTFIALLAILLIMTSAVMCRALRSRWLLFASSVLILPYAMSSVSTSMLYFILPYSGIFESTHPAIYEVLRMIEGCLLWGAYVAPIGLMLACVWVCRVSLSRADRIASCLLALMFLGSVVDSIVWWDLSATWLAAHWPDWGAEFVRPIMVYATSASLLLIGALMLPRRAFAISLEGVCHKCYYALSGLPGDTCPECGTAFANNSN